MTHPVVLTSALALVGTVDGSVTAYDRSSGAVAWRADVAPGDRPKVAYWPEGELVVLAAGTAVQGRDPATGARLWAVATPGQVLTAHIATGDGVGDGSVIAAGDGFVMLLDPATGRERWTATTSTRVSRILIAGDLIIGTAVAIADRGVIVEAFDSRTGRSDWQHSGRAYQSRVSSDGGLVFTVSTDGVSVLDATDGGLVWDRTMTNPVFPTVGAVEDVLIVATPGMVMAFDTWTGERLWRHDEFDGELIGIESTPDALMLATRSGLTAVDLDTGEQRWRNELSASAMHVNDGEVFVADVNRVTIFDSDDGRTLFFAEPPDPASVPPRDVYGDGEGTLSVAERDQGTELLFTPR